MTYLSLREESHRENMLLRAKWVVPVSGVPIEDGAVRVAADRIVAVGRAEDVIGGAEERTAVDLGNSAILPGLVNVHSHLELTVMRGLLEMSDFREWIATLTDIKLTRMDEADLLDSTRLGALEAVQAGVTCCGDTCDSGFAVDALAEAGMRGVVFQEVFGPGPAVAAASLAGLEAKLDRLAVRAPGDRVRVGVSPHAPYTVSGELFRRVTRLALSRSLPVAIHASESAAEDRFVRLGMGPFAERLAARGIEWVAPGTTTIAYLDALGVLECRPLLVHAVTATPEDLDAVARAGAKIAHCPKSNAKFGHGVAPLAGMLARGIPVGFGTDSVASNNVCDVLDEARTAVLMARAAGRTPDALTARGALELATVGGAAALGLEREVGTLEPGKRADLCVVSLDGLHVAPVYDVETAVIFSASAADVSMTVCNGRVIYDRAAPSPSRFDEPRLRARLGEICARLTRS